MLAERSIRVLYLQPAAHFGGAERQAATIVPFLGEFGVETIPVVGPGRAITEWLDERGVSDYILSQSFPGAWRKPRGLARLALPWRYLQCIRAMRRELATLIVDRGIDVVFAATAFSWVAATPVARRLGIPIVWRAGGTGCSDAQRTALSMWARSHRPDLLVCNGEAVQRFYAPLIGAPSCMVRNGLDSEQFHPCAGDPTKLRSPGARVVIGFAGRLVAQKRPQDFIEVAARFAAHRDVTFLFTGDGSLRPHYAELARRAGASTLVATGYLPDMRDFYAACDVLVLPSHSEGCPNVVLEAMATRTAVVAADSPATRELVTSGVDGILYPTGDVDALYDVLESLIATPEWRRILIARSYRRVSRFTARDCAARTAAHLHDVVGNRLPRQLPAQTRRMALQG